MKSYKSLTGQHGGLAVLPTVEEQSETGHERELESRSSNNSSVHSLDEQQGAAAASYPADLLGVSWGSYLYSKPPSRGEAEGQPTEDKSPIPAPKTPPIVTSGANEPHPLLQHLEGLMTALKKSKGELLKCGLDVSPLGPLCNATTTSHEELKELMAALARAGSECNTAVITSDLVHNLVEYLRAVLQGLVGQGRKLNVQAAFLQQTARELSRAQRESLKEQREVQETIRASNSQLEAEREELEKQRQSVFEAKLELKRMLLEAEEKLSSQTESTKKKKGGRMDSPHTVAQGRSQLAALAKTQNQQSQLEKTLVRQQREIRSLQQAHDLAKSGLLAVQDHAMKLQRKLARQIHEVTTTTQGLQHEGPIAPATLPAMERKSYQNTSKAQVKATLKGIVTAQRNLTSEIEQMQRQLSEQQLTERRLSRELEQSCQQLLATDARIKTHASSIRGRGRRSSKIKQAASGEGAVLPPLMETQPPLRKSKGAEGLTLPQIQPPHLHPGVNQRTRTSRHTPLPKYRFSQSELFTLAKFDDHETAEQVMSWLQSQGKLHK